MTRADKIAAALGAFMQRHPRGAPPIRKARRGPETKLKAQIRAALEKECPELVLLSNASGMTRHGERIVRYGLGVGSSDLIGVLGPHGRFVALEVKTPTGRVSDPQRAFLHRIGAAGGITAVVRSVADALELIEWARGLPR